MRQTQLFTKTRKEAPADEVSKNAQLLIRAGCVHKEMAGVYALLPLGLRVLNKIVQIIREEMNLIGGQEVTLTALQNPEVWNKTGRFSDEVIDVWFKTKLKNDTELGLGPTHEEPLTALMTEHIASYRDLPRYVYQFQTKFRNETRAKSGIMRGREFLMKDLYSFCKNSSQHDQFYNQEIKPAYERIFKAVGLKAYFTRASGGSFSKFSHEFQVVCDAGEDTIYISPNFDIAVNEEIIGLPEAFENLPDRLTFKPVKSIEVGNIFTLGTRFSDALNLEYVDEKGEKQKVFMGSYGIGPGRLMGTIVELLSDDKGIVWPESVAPFRVHLVSVGGEKENVKEAADKLYKKLTEENKIEVLYDDRDLRAGEKFADSDLLGLPWRVVVSEKTLAAGNFELKNRASGVVEMATESALLQKLSI